MTHPLMVVTGMAAAALVGSATAGVTSNAPSAALSAPAVHPVVWDIPMPQAPAPDLQPVLLQTLEALAAPGTFREGAKGAYIQGGGLSYVDGVTADGYYNMALQDNKLPLTFSIVNIDQNGGMATADVTTTTAIGASATQHVQFIAGPSPTGWQISKISIMNLLWAAA